MDQICGTPFWNTSVSWDVEKPFLSKCFQNLVLVLGSCGVLWVVAPFEFYKISKFPGQPSPWTKLSIAKITLKVILLIICSIDLGRTIYLYLSYPDSGIDGLLSTGAYFLTIVLTVIITMLCKRRGLRVSLALPSFWMLSTLSTLICIYDDIQDFNQNDWTKVSSLVNNSLTFLISIIQLILSNIADKSTSSRGREIQKKCPLEGVSLPSRLTFSWLLRLLKKSTQNSLHQDYLIPLCSDLRSSFVIKTFYKILEAERRKTSSFIDSRNLTDEGTNFERIPENEASFTASYPKGKSLFIISLKMSRKFMAIASISEIVYTVLYFVPAYILSLLLDEEKRDWHNYLYASALFITLIFSAFADSQRKYYGLMGAMQIKTGLMNAVFEKALKVSQLSKTVKSLLTVHSDNVFKMICLMSEVWGSSIRLLIGVYIFWSFFGMSCFVGIVTAMIIIPVNVIVEQGSNHYQNKAHNKRRDRISLLAECLEGMKILKLYAWEEIFLKKLMSIRSTELSYTRRAGYLKMAFKFLYLSATSIVMLTSVSAHVLMGNSVEIKTIFVSLLLVFLLKPPIRSILLLLAHFVQGLASMSQIQNFLETQEHINISVEDGTGENSVLLTNASFTWDGMDIPCLKNLHLHIPKGSLIAIVGENGCGKSSLLRALLGELQLEDEGTASVRGQLALVSDKPWIQNTTLEKNILFLKPKVEKVYRRILEACDLQEDIEALPACDETEIGEMGIHLTRDQKLKVELARTVYQNADVYLLDNPLQHLESSLAEHIFHRVIGRSGLLKEKTRILVVTKEDFLPLVDFILVMKNGRILEKGTYSQLKDKDGHLTEYFRTLQSSQHLLKNSTPSKFGKLDSENACESNFGKQSDIWYSTAVEPCKMKLEHCETIGIFGFGHKLMDLLKTLGFVLTTISILMAGLACACEAASGVWLSEWTDGNGAGQEPLHNLLIYSGFILSQVFLTVVCGVSFFATSTRAAEKLHTWLLLRIARSSQTAFEMTSCKKIIQSFNADFHYMDEQIPETFYVWLMACLRAPSLLVVIFVVSPFAGIMSTTLVFAFLVIQKLYLNTWQQMQRLTIATSCPLSSLLDDTLRGASSIRATRSYQHFVDRFQTKVDTHNNCSLLFLLVSRWLSSSVDIVTAFLVLWTTVMGFYERDKGDGFIGLAIVFSIQMAETLTNAVYISSLMNNDLKSLERLKSLSEIKQESEWDDPANRPPPSWPESGSILVQNLSTAYGERMHPVLHNISFSVQPGEKVAIVGKEESGIVTLLYSLFRLIEPLEGTILIDNLDISKLGLKDLRSRLAVIPQDIFTFRGTVRENLDPKSAYKDGEIWLALEVVGLKNSITNLDSSIETYSSTETYYFSVVRCVLEKPKLIIIEEFETPEKLIQFFPDSTVLFFSNHPLTDFDGRTIKMISGEVISQEFSSSNQEEV